MRYIENCEDAIRFCRERIPHFCKLTDLQKALFYDERFWNNKQNVFIEGCTSSGKTLPALMAMRAKLGSGNTPRTLYIVPYRALAYQKYQELLTLWSGEEIILSTGEYKQSDELLQSGGGDIVVTIYEKVFMFYHLNIDFLKSFDLIVLDEFGIVEKDERGIKADFVFRWSLESEKRVMVLTTPNFEWGYYKELGDFLCVRQTERPVPLEETLIMRYKWRNPETKKTIHKLEIEGTPIIDFQTEGVQHSEIVMHICEEHWKKGNTILVFMNDRSWVKSMSGNLYKTLIDKKIIEQTSEKELKKYRNELLEKTELFEDVLDTVLDKQLLESFKNGIVFHNAGLPMELRKKIEDDFFCKDKKIRVIFATETLAYGINSSVDVVVIADINSQGKMLSPSAYYNYVGRAGRYGISDRGYVYTIIKKNRKNEWKQNILTENSMLQSRIFELDADHIAIYLLSLFETRHSYMDINEMCRKLLKLPHAKTVEPEKLKETIEEAVKNLESVFLIGKVSTLILEKNVRYKISERGLKVRGYILSMESFKTLYDAIKNSQKEDGIYFFDLFYYLTNTEEIIKDEVRPEKGAWKESDDRTNPVVQFIRHSASWEERGIISSELKNKITEKIEIGILYMGDKLRIWKTIFLILRIESRNERYVFKETKMENGIGQRFSESMSFLLDCLNAYVTATKSFEKYCTILGILSQAVFYGVNPDVLQAEPELAKDIVANKKRLQNLSRIYCNNINKR